jgi:ABC-type branched-subunit amino acid transport system substrate-binding protein
MTQLDETSRLSALKDEIERLLDPLRDTDLDDLDAKDRERVARRYGKRLHNAYQQLEAEWARLLITERDANSKSKQQSPDQRSSREFELFGVALGLLPLACELKNAQQKLLPQSPEQSPPRETGTLDTGLQALKSGDLQGALALLADISETDISSSIQYRREVEAAKLLQAARNEQDKLAQREDGQEEQQIHERMRQDFIESVIRLGREVQREAAQQMLPSQSGLEKLIGSRLRLIPLAVVVLLLLCGAGVLFLREGSGSGVATGTTSTPSVAPENTPTDEPSVSSVTSTSTPDADLLRPTSTFVPTVTSTPSMEPSVTPTSEPPTPSVTATLSPTTELAVAETRTPSPDVIKIALQSPQTGTWSGIGIGIRRGAELAILQQNPPLTDQGFRVEFASFDDAGNPEQGIANAQQIVADPDVLCKVGPFNSGVTLAAYEAVYKNTDLVVISPGATNPDVTDETEQVWRVVGRDDIQGVVAAQFAREELQSQRAYVIHDNTDYGRGIASFFRDNALANGPPALLAFTFFDDSQEEVDFTPFLEDIQEQNPDLIFFAGSYSRAGEFFRQVRTRGIGAQFLGSDSIDNPGLVEIAGAEVVDGMHFTTVAAPVSEFPDAGQFAQDYRERYGEEAPPFSPEAYDATTLCIQAIARAAEANGGQKPTRRQVVDIMSTFQQRESRFEGISGRYRFTPNGDPVEVAYFVVQVNAADWSENKVVESLFAEPPNQ